MAQAYPTDDDPSRHHQAQRDDQELVAQLPIEDDAAAKAAEGLIGSREAKDASVTGGGRVDHDFAAKLRKRLVGGDDAP